MKIAKICLSIVILALMLSVSAFAAPEVLYPSQVYNSGSLIVIQNPPTDKAATFDSSYVISGYGQNGTTVTIYKLSGDKYVKTDYSWTIGASNTFYKKIWLNKGKNLLVCYAEGRGTTQGVKLQITNLGSYNSINNYKPDLSF